MKIYESFDRVQLKDTPVCLALGNFDGVHAGHRALLECCSKKARESGMTSAVFTFDQLTANAVAGKLVVKRLMSAELKAIHIEETGISHMISVPFERSTMELSPRAFVDRILECADVRFMVCGFNYRFGYKAAGDTELLAELCKEKGIELAVIPEYTVNGATVSSTLLRGLVASGDLEGYRVYSGKAFAIGKDALEPSDRSTAGRLVMKAKPWQVVPPEGNYLCQVRTGYLDIKCSAAITTENNDCFITIDILYGDPPAMVRILQNEYFEMDFI